MNKWQYLPRDLWFLKWKALGASSPLADFGRLRKTSDFFGNLRKWSCRLQKSQHSQDKNLTLISHKTLAGILLYYYSALLFTLGLFWWWMGKGWYFCLNCFNYTVAIWKTKMLTCSTTASKSTTLTGSLPLKTRKCLFHVCTTAQNSNPGCP